MNPIQPENRIAGLEARDTATGSSLDLASRLSDARERTFEPTRSQAELQRLAAGTDRTARVARGLLRLGEDFYLPDDAAAPRATPEQDPDDTIVNVMGAVTVGLGEVTQRAVGSGHAAGKSTLSPSSS